MTFPVKMWQTIAEFLLGWVILPRVLFFIFGFIFIYLGFQPVQMLLYTKILEAVIIVLLFFVRKAVAIGYLMDYVLDLVGVYSLVTGVVS